MLFIRLYLYHNLWASPNVYIFNSWFTWIVDKQVFVTATFILIVAKFLSVSLLISNERARLNYKIMGNINLLTLN